MQSQEPAAATIDEYIAAFPPEVRALLEQVRATIRQAAPEAVEAISYRMPAFKLKGRNLVYFAGYKKHIGVYPLPGGDAQFVEALSPYQTGKGTARFPLDKPIPFELIGAIVQGLVKDHQERAAKRTLRE